MNSLTILKYFMGTRKLLLLIIGLLSSIALSFTFGSKQPNIIFVLTDDQRWDAVGYAGNEMIHTPNLDQLASEGVQFSNAFVTTAICMSSRGSILTGLYERTHLWRDCKTVMDRRIWTEFSYPSLLKKAGYYTGFVGKFDVNIDRGGWRDPSYGEAFFDDYRPFYFRPLFHEIDGKQVHRDDLEVEAAIDFLRERPDDKPFCLSLWLNAPHADHVPSPRHLKQYKGQAMPERSQESDEIFKTLPDFIKTSMARERWHWYFETAELREETIRAYYGQVSGIDEAVGQLRAALKDLSLDDSTIIVFTSDNGYFLGDRGLSGKWLMYEASIRVPMILYDPRRVKRKSGRVIDELVLNIDIAPTILELAGVPKLANSMHGRSLLPLLRDSQVDWRTDFFYEHRRDCPENLDQIQSEGVRTRDWKYIRYRKMPGNEELYNLEADPSESINLAKDEFYRSQLRLMRERCNEYINIYSR